MTRRDDAVSSIVGAILVLALLGGAILYVNAFYVPREGRALESSARDDARGALAALADDLTTQAAPFQRGIPLASPAAAPPLLAGIVLEPARPTGNLTLAVNGTTISISHVTSLPAAGVVAGDPTRVAENGKMRVYDWGNATSGRPVGRLGATLGGAYLQPVEYRLEGGLLLAERDGVSSLLVGPAWSVGASADGTATTLSANLPVLSGAPGDERGATGLLRVTPGAPARAGAGQLVYNATILVRTDSLSAWTSALQKTVGARGSIVVAADAPGADSGTVTATILPPAGTPATTRAVSLDVTVTRVLVELTGATT